jgi:uncharacterized protein YukE
MAENYKLLVTPEKLEQTAKEIRSSVKEVRQIKKKMHSLVYGIHYWEGDAKKKHKSIYDASEKVIEESAKNLILEIEKLEKMVGVYKTVEQANTATAKALSENII